MNVTVHQDGYLILVVKEHIIHVMVILVRMMDYVKLMELIIFVIAFHVSFKHIASYLNDFHSN